MLYVVVFDTNIRLSALLSLRGNPFRCLALAKTGAVQSVTCEEILNEFQGKLETKFGYAPKYARAAADEVRNCSKVVAITRTLQVVTADPDDDIVLECAVVGGATHVITGYHRHLLPLGSYQGISIVTAADFLSLMIQ